MFPFQLIYLEETSSYAKCNSELNKISTKKLKVCFQAYKHWEAMALSCFMRRAKERTRGEEALFNLPKDESGYLIFTQMIYFLLPILS